MSARKMISHKLDFPLHVNIPGERNGLKDTPDLSFLLEQLHCDFK